MKLFRRIRALFHKEKLDAEMAEEMRAHLEMQAAENERRGLSPAEARDAARRQFGGVEQIKEQVREQRGIPWLEQTWCDLRYAIRALRKGPAFALTAIATLALGIGLVTVQFSVIHGALLRGLPFEGSDRIMAVTPLDARGRARTLAAEDFVAWREQQKSLAGFAAFAGESLELSGAGLDARSFRGAAFSSGVLELLRVAPVLGRGFLPDDEKPDAAPVLLLSHDVWQNIFAADREIVGRVLRLRGQPATVVGVLPPRFAFPENDQVWTNLRLGVGAASGRLGAPERVSVVARLRDDATLATARAELEVLAARTFAANANDPNQPRTVRMWPFTKRPDDSKIVVVLMSLLGVVGGVLAIACLNVANLLSARALQRTHELALRSALGASRGRLVRQMLVESSLLALLGAGGGLLLALWSVPLVNRGLAADAAKPFWIEVTLDPRVLGAMALLTLLVGVVAGLVPALRATRADANAVLKDSAAGAASVWLGRANRVLVLVQVAVSCAVLLGTSALMNAVLRQSRLDLPFDPAKTLMADVRLQPREFRDQAARVNFQLTLLERLRALPGVTAATISRGYPLQRAAGTAIEAFDSATVGVGQSLSIYLYDHVADGFFRDLRIAVRAGRDFTPADGDGSEPVAIVNEAFARTFWPGESAVGKKIRRVAAAGDSPEPWLTIVGVTTDLSVDPLTYNGGMVVHVPLRQGASAQVTMLVTVAGDPMALARPVRDLVRSLSSDLPVENLHPVAWHYERKGAAGRVFGVIAAVFAGSALLLAAVGVYGVTAFSVQRRTREFGVRLALGARPADLLALVFRQGFRQLAVGLIVGSAAGWFLGRPMARIVTRQAGPPGLESYAIVFALVAGTLAFALWWPARRAAKVDPMTALRSE